MYSVYGGASIYGGQTAVYDAGKTPMAFTPMYNIHTPAADRNADINSQWGYQNNNQTLFSGRGKYYFNFNLLQYQECKRQETSILLRHIAIMVKLKIYRLQNGEAEIILTKTISVKTIMLICSQVGETLIFQKSKLLKMNSEIYY